MRLSRDPEPRAARVPAGIAWMLVTTFFFGDVKNDRTFLFPPILRREVLELRPTRDDVVLVYATQAFESLLERLRGGPS